MTKSGIAILPILIPALIVAVLSALLLRRSGDERKKAERTGKPVPWQTRLIWIALGLFIALYAAGCVFLGSTGFLSLRSFLNLFNSNAALLCLACGATCVMLTGGIDLSVGALVGLDCMILAVGMEKNQDDPTRLVLFVLLLGVLFGLFQGFLIGYLNLKPVYVTLGGMLVARGVTTLIGTETIAIRSENWFRTVARFKLRIPIGEVITGKRDSVSAVLTVPVLAALAVVILTALLLRYARLGRNLRAVGGGERSAALAGVDVRRTKMLAYVLSSLLCSLGGILYCMYTLSANPSIGQGLEMRAVASAAIGGTLLTGGAGSVLGSFIGVLIQGTIQHIIAYSSSLSRMGGAANSLATALLLALAMALQAAVFRPRKEAEAAADAAPDAAPEAREEKEAPSA